METLKVVQEINEREIILSYLERARELWLPHHRRAERAGGWNAEANLAAEQAMVPIDRLLGELSALDVVEVVEVPHG